MLLFIIPLLVPWACLCDASINTYDRYTSELVTKELMEKYEAEGLTSTCTIDIADCDPNERRRVDGSCNSLTNPVSGTYFVPIRRMLPKQYSNDSDLKLPRVIRNKLLSSGRANSLTYTQATPAFGVWMFSDFASVHDMINFLSNKTDCCTKEHMNDYECTPNIIPEDDPVHRFSGIRCMNHTRPKVFSDYGCTDDPESPPVQLATPQLDLSHMYNLHGDGDKYIRTYVGGMLTVDIEENGEVYPPSGPAGYCPAAQPGETRCFGYYPTELLSVMLISIWFMRNHNFFAAGLAEVNPHWDDETLFQTARDMNIGFAMQIYYYEWLETVMGHKYLIEKGVISEDPGFRDLYDSSKHPEVSLEFVYVLRWFHVMQDATANMYYPDGTFIKEFPYTNITFRPGFLVHEHKEYDGYSNLVLFTQHLFRQATGSGDDYVADPSLMDLALAYIQDSTDTLTSDLHKGRLLGLPPYKDYVEACTGDTIKSFEDLKPHMPLERIEKMQEAYSDVEHIDLMAGLWSENYVEGGTVPKTLACIYIDYLKRVLEHDRHWFERPNRPHPYTANQLAEIRKASLAILMCNTADLVTEVQPHAMRVISPENPLTPCSELPNIDFSAWADPQ